MGKRHARVFGYARVSSVEQALGTSLQDQQNAISAHVAKLGLKVARFFVESESGIHEKIERREQIRALLASVKAGDLICCDKLDRWSRDPEFTYRSIREMLAAGASFYAVGDACDPSTPEGDTMLGFRVLFAREEHKRIKQRLVGTRKLLRDRGLYVEGLPPWGYRRQEDKKGAERVERNVLVLEPDEAEKVKRAFKLCVAGKTITEIAEALDVGRKVISAALHRRLYIGEIQDAEGAWIRGKHPAIIDARTFQAAQEALAGRMNGSRSDRDAEAETANWWLRDVARCALCGAKMSAAYAGPKGESRRYYFKCSKKCGAKFVPVPAAEQQVDYLLMQGRLNELREELAAPPAPVKGPAVDVRERRAKLEARRAKYIELHADGVTSRDELRTQIARLDAERMKLDALEVVEPPPSPERRREELRAGMNAIRWWRRMPSRLRRVVVNRLAVSIGLALTGDDFDELVPQPVWRPAAEVNLSEIAELLVQVAPTRAEERAQDATSAKWIEKLRAKAR